MSASTAEAATAKFRTIELVPTEAELRVQLAAGYRLVEHFGWNESIYGHLTVRVPGPERHFLINPYGLRYGEVTASNLVKITLDGEIVGDTAWSVIGIGGHLTMPPLPHHRAYGSVPRRFDRIRPQQGCRVWGGRASRNGGCVGPAGPHVRPCASTPSASQRRWRLGPLRVPGGGAP